MLDNPLISIIVPNYNHEKFLKQRLDSIFNQTYQNFEVILLDDCSKDNSRDILLEYYKRAQVTHCVFNEKNSGNTFLQWERGIDLAKGEFIWIAESDDYCELNFLEKMVSPLIENREIGLSYCQSNRVNENGVVTGNWKSHTDNYKNRLFDNDFVINGTLFVEKFLIKKNVIPNASALLIRKETLKLVGDISVEKKLRYCGDWLLYFKIALHCKVNFVHDNLNNFRYHSNSVIASAVRSEDRISIIDIDFIMRSKMISYLKTQKTVNKYSILKANKKVINNLKYEKGLFYIRNNKKLKGFGILLSIFNFFVRKYKFRKNLKMKFKKKLS